MFIRLIIFLFLFSCAKEVPKPVVEFKKKKPYKVDTIFKKEMVMADLNTSRIFVDSCYELWINTETGGAPYHYIDKFKKEFPENILVMPNSQKIKNK